MQSLTSRCHQTLKYMNWKFFSGRQVLILLKFKSTELRPKISSLWNFLIPPPNGVSYLNVSGYSWSSAFHLQTRTRVHNSLSHIIISFTSVATWVNAVAHVNICTTICLPSIRIRMKNDYAWTPVFDKNESKDRKRNKAKHDKIQKSLFLNLLYSSARVNHCVRFGKQNDIRHPVRKGDMKRAPQP